MTNIEKWEELKKEFLDKFPNIEIRIGNEYHTGLTATNYVLDWVKTLLQSEQTRIAEEVEKMETDGTDGQGYVIERVLSIIKQGK
jgi:hypothetical protein